MASRVVISYERIDELERVIRALKPHIDRDRPVKTKHGEKYAKLYLWIREDAQGQ